MTATYNDLYLDVRKGLKKTGIEAASLEARELICAASGKTREQFFRDLPLYAPDFVQQKLEDLLLRRMQGEPVAYLVGEWEFYGLTLTINHHVLIPRPDTEVLVERAISLIEEAGTGCRILDLCAGSGCIGLAVANHVKECRAVLVDASAEAIQVCKQNIRRNNLSGRVTALHGDAKCEPDSTLWDFDVIACNPPYIPTGDIPKLDPSVRDYEPHLALDGGSDGLDFYRLISSLWANSLRLGGTILFEVGIGQADRVKKVLEEAGYEDIRIHRDPAGIPRVLEGHVSIG
ncbi:MAG: protein-(glutamine-N5) methyltransferase, release factor-specific [Evtepia sp.]|jgi:release factor glutamine methyltransferase|nr:protein-(glutamine-N5) methyltransferase, release factor-specific [Evtepia sp.]